jgi:hypothetical protein
MTTPHEIYLEAARRGLRLEPAGDKLAVIPKGRCPPDFADVLRQHKGELLDWLEAHATNLPPDCAPWLHVARQVVEGEFDAVLDDSVRGSLEIGLRSILHPLCQQALVRLQKQQNN